MNESTADRHVLDTADGAEAAAGRVVRILAITDEVDNRLYSPSIASRLGRVDLVLSCGDLPYEYLDYVASMLQAPLYGVHGNHDVLPMRADGSGRRAEWGMGELHGRVVREQGLLIAGFDGCLRYNDGAYQYTEVEMRTQVALLVPRLLYNRARHGRYLDVLVTHAPPRHIHDQEDRCHQGFAVFRWFLRTFRPRYHLHGHIHVYDNRAITQTRYHDTVVLNAYPYRELTLAVGERWSRIQPGGGAAVRRGG